VRGYNGKYAVADAEGPGRIVRVVGGGCESRRQVRIDKVTTTCRKRLRRADVVFYWRGPSSFIGWLTCHSGVVVKCTRCAQFSCIVHLRLCEVSIPPNEYIQLGIVIIKPSGSSSMYIVGADAKFLQFLPVRQFEPGTERNWTGKNGSYLFGPVQFLVLAGGCQFSSQFSQRGKEPD
jgi:hypothetical protein